MCGILGYIGSKNNISLGLKGLKRLEYRGYDSAGMAVVKGDEFVSVKSDGKVDDLKEKIENVEVEGTPSLFHNRWSTHGKPSTENAHPQFSCNKEFAVVHNGIIENYRELKAKLIEENHEFTSETDTEVIAHLIEKFYEGNLEKAVRRSLKLVEGAYGLAVISTKEPDKIVGASLSSPIAVSVNEAGGFIASDPAAIIEHSRDMVFLEDREIAVVTEEDFEVNDLENKPQEKEEVTIDWDLDKIKKSGHPHFMLKEMLEQPETLKNAIRGRVLEKEGEVKLGGLESVKDQLQSLKKLTILGCGTSHLSAQVGKYLIEEIAGLSVEVGLASEFSYRDRPDNSKEGFLFISQSGETADTLNALERVSSNEALTLGIVNVVGSSIARKVEAGIYTHAGPEIGVASTKAFTSQLTVLILLAVYLGRQRKLSSSRSKTLLKELKGLPELVEQVLESRDQLKKLANKYSSFDDFLYIGRHVNYPTALEGALKLKEISYLHAEGYSAAEMKHGPIALIDEEFPTFAICPQDSMYDKMLTNIEEIKSRQGPIIALGTKGDEKIEEIADEVFYLPQISELVSPIVTVVPLQLFAYYLAVAKGLDPDKPRNLSKVVTVE